MRLLPVDVAGYRLEEGCKGRREVTEVLIKVGIILVVSEDGALLQHLVHDVV